MPAVRGTEMYYAERQQVVGSGYAQEVRWVNTPLCKGCTEMMQVIYAKGEKTKRRSPFSKLSERFLFLY